MTEPIRLAQPDVGDAELAAVAEVVRAGGSPWARR